MGGLEFCRIFRLPGVRKLLARSQATHRWRDILATIEDEGSFRKYRNVHGTAASVFRRLLEKGTFQAGLAMTCPACGIRSRYPVDGLATEMRCARCGSVFLLAPRLETAHWEYQASGFFAHHHEHGAIPVLLTMLRLEHDVQERALFLVPGRILASDAFEGECDFIALHQRYDGSLTVAVGECRGGSKKIREEDVEKLGVIVDKVRGSGIECYLVFATTRLSFDADEITALRAYRARVENDWSLDDPMHGRSRPAPILFTWRELQSFEAYEGELRERLPEQYPLSLRDLSVNSSFVYLDKHDDPLPTQEPDRLFI
jgi:hypothetical protein